jgi:hypothetical protein
MLVSYSNESEVLVCQRKDEARFLKLYFDPDNRDVEEYDRSEGEVAKIKSIARVSVDKFWKSHHYGK